MAASRIALASASAAAAEYSVITATFDVHVDYVCHGRTTKVFYPDGAGSFPVVVYAHGQGTANPSFEGCTNALQTVASHGLIVIAPMSDGFAPDCTSKNEYKDLFHALKSAKEYGHEQVPMLGTQADWSRLALWGFSMGAKTATRAAGHADAHGVTIQALVASHGARHSERIPANIDTLYVTGTEDTSSSPPSKMFQQYKMNPSDTKVYANLQGHPHTEACSGADPAGQGLMNAWVGKFLRCSLAGEHCDEVYGGGLCAANPYKSCFAHGPRGAAANASHSAAQPIMV